MKELSDLSWHEAGEFYVSSQSDRLSPEDWVKAQNNANQILEKANQAIEAFRLRVRSWEQLDGSEQEQ